MRVIRLEAVDYGDEIAFSTDDEFIGGKVVPLEDVLNLTRKTIDFFNEAMDVCPALSGTVEAINLTNLLGAIDNALPRKERP